MLHNKIYEILSLFPVWYFGEPIWTWWECLTAYKICDYFNPTFITETPSHAVFLAEARSEKVKQMPHVFSSIWKHMVGDHNAI